MNAEKKGHWQHVWRHWQKKCLFVSASCLFVVAQTLFRRSCFVSHFPIALCNVVFVELEVGIGPFCGPCFRSSCKASAMAYSAIPPIPLTKWRPQSCVSTSARQEFPAMITKDKRVDCRASWLFSDLIKNGAKGRVLASSSRFCPPKILILFQ